MKKKKTPFKDNKTRYFAQDNYQCVRDFNFYFN